MRSLLILLFCFFSLSGFACVIPEGRELDYAKKEFEEDAKSKIESTDFLVDGIRGKMLRSLSSCSNQGCESLLLIESSPRCFKEVLSFSGKLILKDNNSWNEFEIHEKLLAVDFKKSNATKYNFDKTLLLYKKKK